jgi:AsmA protein
MRKILMISGSVIILIVVALLILPFVLPANNFRSAIQSQLTSATGMDVNLNGDIGISVFPQIVVSADNVQIVGSEETTTIDTLELKRVRFEMTLASLFSSRKEIKGITLIEPVVAQKTIEAIANSDNQTVNSQEENKEEKASAVTEKNNQSVISVLETLSLQNIVIVDGTYRSADVQINNINIEVSAPALDNAIEMTGSFVSEDTEYEFKTQAQSFRALLTGENTPVSLRASMAPSPISDDSIRLSGSLSHSGTMIMFNNASMEVAGQTAAISLQYVLGNVPEIKGTIMLPRLDISALSKSKNAVQTTSTSFETNQVEARIGQDTGYLDTSTQSPLQALAGTSADIKFEIGTLVTPQTEVSPVIGHITLQENILEIGLDEFESAGGNLQFAARTDVTEEVPTIYGTVNAENISLQALASLTSQSIPVTGILGLDIEYGFRGLTQQDIQSSLNTRGEISISNGSYQQLSNLNAKVSVTQLDDPVVVSGSSNVSGRPSDFTLRFKPLDFIQQQQGAIAVTLNQDGSSLSANGTASTSGTFNGSARVNTRSLSSLEQLINTSLPAIPASFEGQVELAPQSFAMRDASLSLGDTTLNGNASANFSVSPVEISADLQAGVLDLAALSAFTTNTAPAAAPAKQQTNMQASAGAGNTKTSPLSGIDANIEIKAQGLKIGNAQTGPANVLATVKDSVASLNIPDVSLYDGQANLVAEANGNVTPMQISARAKIENVNARPFLSATSGFDRLEGKLNFATDIQAAGATADTIKQSLNGTASVNFSDGALRGIDISRVYATLASILTTGILNQSPQDATYFTQLKADFGIENGIARSSNILMTGPAIRMTGQGQLSIPAETVSLRLLPEIVTTPNGGAVIAGEESVKVPVIVEGNWSSPRVYPDLQTILANPEATLKGLEHLGISVGNISDKIKLDGNRGQAATQALQDVLKGDAPTEAIGRSLNRLLGGNRQPEGDTAPPQPQPDPSSSPQEQTIAPADPEPLAPQNSQALTPEEQAQQTEQSTTQEPQPQDPVENLIRGFLNQ